MDPLKWSSLVIYMVKNLPAMLETWVCSLCQEDPLDKGMAIHSVFLPANSTDRGVWLVTADGVAKSQTRLTN